MNALHMRPNEAVLAVLDHHVQFSPDALAVAPILGAVCATMRMPDEAIEASELGVHGMLQRYNGSLRPPLRQVLADLQQRLRERPFAPPDGIADPHIAILSAMHVTLGEADKATLPVMQALAASLVRMQMPASVALVTADILSAMTFKPTLPAHRSIPTLLQNTERSVRRKAR